MKYAIVESGGKQYKAVEGATIEVDLLEVEVGASVDLDKVLLLVEDEKISIGTPTLKGAVVTTKVVDHVKGPKVIIFKYSPKKRIRVKTGHRQQYTQLKIESIKVE
ncbi:MAG: 50S ribosomal protein L21 [Anaerolineaceae bacterium]